MRNSSFWSRHSDMFFGAFVLLFAFAAAFGWMWNVVKIFGAIPGPITGMFILRIAGVIVAPLGAVLGFC